MTRRELLKTVQSSLRLISNELDGKSFKKSYLNLKSGKSKYLSEYSSIPKVDGNGVFANHPCSLKYINGYGFDYDHTLANYTKASANIIYENAINYLIKNENYPHDLYKKCEFNPDFAIRGLQFDRKTGNVLKLNQFHKLNPRTIRHGHDIVDISTILEQYGGVRVSEIYFKKNMRELSDLFCAPETCLYCDIIQYFKDNKYDFESQYVADDIRKAINFIHNSGLFHMTVANNPTKYVEKLPNLSSYIKQLLDNNKKIFLLTNSSFDYIDSACKYLFEDVCAELGNLNHWTKIFNYTILNAHKPKWFNSSAKFRSLDIQKKSTSIYSVDTFTDGGVYVGGSLGQFHQLTQLRNDQVIYFGDNIGSDLIGPTKTGQWKTAAVIKELEREITVVNHEEFRERLSYLLDVEHLWFDGQHLSQLNDDEINKMLSDLTKSRSDLRDEIKKKYNQQFGSIFRTHSTRTLFFHRLARYCDLYTSKVTNMQNYPLNYKFGSRRQYYDHEPVL